MPGFINHPASALAPAIAGLLCLRRGHAGSACLNKNAHIETRPSLFLSSLLITGMMGMADEMFRQAAGAGPSASLGVAGGHGVVF